MSGATTSQPSHSFVPLSLDDPINAAILAVSHPRHPERRSPPSPALTLREGIWGGANLPAQPAVSLNSLARKIMSTVSVPIVLDDSVNTAILAVSRPAHPEVSKQ